MLTHIAALSKNHVIGVDGDLPWKLSEDLKFFKSQTLNHCIIMGRKTFDSIGRALPKRINIVISRNKDLSYEGAFVFQTVEEAIAFCSSKHSDKKQFIIGGGQLYKSTLDQTEELILTEIDKTIEGDTYYPEFRESFKLVDSQPQQQDELQYSFNRYKRIAKL